MDDSSKILFDKYEMDLERAKSKLMENKKTRRKDYEDIERKKKRKQQKVQRRRNRRGK